MLIAQLYLLISCCFCTIDLEYFGLSDLFSFLFGIAAAYTFWYEIITKLAMALKNNPAEIENELFLIKRGY